MNSRKHIYYLTVADIQNVAKDIIDRKLESEELAKVISKLQDRIQWYDPIELTILNEIKMST